MDFANDLELMGLEILKDRVVFVLECHLCEEKCRIRVNAGENFPEDCFRGEVYQGVEE